jgi:hypothetical protein
MERLVKNILLSTTLLSTSAFANMPVKYSKCPMKVNTPSNSAGHFMSEDCQTLYVLPALKHRIKAENVMTNASVHECRIIKEVNANYKAKRKFLEKQLNYARSGAFRIDQEELSKLTVELEKNQEEVNEALTDLDYVLKNAEVALAKVEEIKANIAGLDQSSIAYMMTEMELKRAIDELDRANRDKSDVEFDLKDLQREVSRIEGLIAKKQLEVEEKRKSDESIYEQIRVNLGEQAKDGVIQQYLKEIGATAKVKLTNNSMKVVNMYKVLNPHITKVMPLPTHTRLKFTTNMLSENNLTAVIGGAEFIGKVENTTYNQYEVPFSNSIDATIDIDKYTTCTKGKYRIKSEIDSVVNANVYYEYDLLVNSHYKLTYKMSEIYKKIKKHSKKNGIFKSSNSVKMMQDLKESEAFRFEFYNQDVSLEIQEKQKEAIISRFIDRAIRSLGVSLISHQTGKGMDLPGQIQAGAPQAAEKLRKNCQSEYCQYAALALDIGHDLFGGSEQSNSFISSHSSEQEEVFEVSKPIKHYGSAGFSRW